MNYNDQILENKAFSFFKQLMYNIALAICIMLAMLLILVLGFKFELYEVLSDSQAPYFKTGDMVVVREANEYKVGDILTFKQGNMLVTHRLIAIKDNGTSKTYYCHGDNVQSANPNSTTYTAKWQDDSAYVQNLVNTNQDVAQKSNNVQVVNENQVKGKVLNHIDNYGTYFKFIKDHYLLFIALVAGIWCISSVVQNEIDVRKCRRLL